MREPYTLSTDWIKPGVYTVTDAAGLSITIQKRFVFYITATIEVTPNVIKGNNGVKALTSNNGYYNEAKLGQFKFEISDFTGTHHPM